VRATVLIDNSAGSMGNSYFTWEQFVENFGSEMRIAGEVFAGMRHIDPVVRMAIAHDQFEAIDLFTDGNGRRGRILILLMLVEQGLLDQPALYLSRYIIKNKAAYYDGLLSVTTRCCRPGDPSPWPLQCHLMVS